MAVTPIVCNKHKIYKFKCPCKKTGLKNRGDKNYAKVN